MPRDVAGNYTLPAGNPVVPNTIIATNWANTTMQDIADALSASLSIDGSVTTAKIADDAVTPPKLAGLDADGMVARISATEFEGRTITGTANKVTVSNGDGVAGNPTLTLPDAITLVTPTVTGAADFDSTVNVDGAATINNSLTIKRTAGTAAGIELGNVDNQASSPFIDFHSGTDGTNDFDSRIAATGGTASDGGGTINLLATNAQVGGSELYRRANILGSVTESGGTPTGAIIERGSNANGEYAKFADGTLICKQNLTQSDINTATGTVFTSGEILWTYPATYAAAPSIAARIRDFGDTWAGSGGSATTTTQCVVQAFRGATFTGGPYGVEILAIGRWF